MHIPERRTSQGQQPQEAQAMESAVAGAGSMEGQGRRAGLFLSWPLPPGLSPAGAARGQGLVMWRCPVVDEESSSALLFMKDPGPRVGREASACYQSPGIGCDPAPGAESKDLLLSVPFIYSSQPLAIPEFCSPPSDKLFPISSPPQALATIPLWLPDGSLSFLLL